jgi:hypothetical protein
MTPENDESIMAYECRWIRAKLGLPADASTGDVQGEVARLEAKIRELELAAMEYYDWKSAIQGFPNLPVMREQMEENAAENRRLKRFLNNLRSYVAVEGYSDNEGTKVVGLAYEGSIWGPMCQPSAHAYELAESFENWLHDKIDVAMRVKTSAGQERRSHCPSCAQESTYRHIAGTVDWWRCESCGRDTEF